MVFWRGAVKWRSGDEVALGISAGFVAVGLMAVALLIVGYEPKLEITRVESRSSAEPRPRAGGDAALDPHTQRLLRDFALNALLTPLLDDSGHPLRWGDPRLLLTCGEPSDVEVDGAPVAVGREWHGRAFTVRWFLDGCMPFGTDGPALEGIAEIDVFPENEGLSAIVRFERVTARRNLGVELLDKHFIAHAPWPL